MNNQSGEKRSFANYEADQAAVMQQVVVDKSDQSLVLGIIGGVVAAIVSAILWAVITAVTHAQIGFIAVGVGFLVGMAVRLFGRGSDPIFGMVGAVLSLAAILVGNLLAAAIFVSNDLKIPLAEVLPILLKPGVAGQVLSDGFSVIDLVFYGIALYEGYRFAVGGVRRVRRTSATVQTP